MLMNKWVKYGLSCGAVVLIGACSISTSMDATLEREIEATTELKERAKAPAEIVQNDVVHVKDEIWLGDKSEVEYDGSPVPAYLETKDGITLISNRPITLYEIGGMITKITSIRVRYASGLEDEVKNEAKGNEPTPDKMNAHWAEPGKMLVSYRGPLSGLLDEVAAHFGLWWKYDKNEVHFYKFVSKTFVIYSLPTQQSLNAQVGGSSTDSGSAGDSSVSLTSQASLELWNNIQETISSMISSDAKLALDKNNGTISLTATPTDIKKVASYVNELNSRLSRQVAISVKVLQVNVTDSDSFGLNFEAAFDDGQTVLGAASPAGLGEDITKNLTMKIMPGNWKIDTSIQALSKRNTTNLVTSGTVTTMNNKPAPIQVVKKQNYISEITKTNSGGDGDNYDLSTETEEIETGFTMSVLPRILEHGRMLLMFNMTLSDLLELQKVDLSSSGEGGEFIQNPVIESRGFSQEVALKSGESLVLTGFERVENSADKTGFGSADNSLLGGSAAASKVRSILVIILTPVVIESPLDPETRVHE